MFHYYLQRGHSLKELESLSAMEKAFFMAGMQLEAERKNQLVEGMSKALEGLSHG